MSELVDIYNKKLHEYMGSLSNKSFIFEVTKCCDYSCFVYLYKNETLLELYQRVSHEFTGCNIKRLYFISSVNQQIIDIPMTDLISMKDFIYDNTSMKEKHLVPQYPLPCPVVYKIFLHDGYGGHFCNEVSTQVNMDINNENNEVINCSQNIQVPLSNHTVQQTVDQNIVLDANSNTHTIALNIKLNLSK
jgi:hypothetical protein